MSDYTRLPPLNGLRIISKNGVRIVIAPDDKHARRREKAGKFPRLIDLGDGRVGWLESELIKWIRSRPVPEFPASDDDTK